MRPFFVFIALLTTCYIPNTFADEQPTFEITLYSTTHNPFLRAILNQKQPISKPTKIFTMRAILNKGQGVTKLKVYGIKKAIDISNIYSTSFSTMQEHKQEQFCHDKKTVIGNSSTGVRVTILSDRTNVIFIQHIIIPTPPSLVEINGCQYALQNTQKYENKESFHLKPGQSQTVPSISSGRTLRYFVVRRIE